MTQLMFHWATTHIDIHLHPHQHSYFSRAVGQQTISTTTVGPGQLSHDAKSMAKGPNPTTS